MKKDDETFALVKSLSKSEKRFFKLNSALTDGRKNYLEVFNAMDKMKEYDTKKLSSKLRSHKLNLSHEKQYLSKQILKTLRVFHAENSAELFVNNLLQDIELLINHRQFTACQKLIRKTIMLCVENELFPEHMITLRWQLAIAQRMGNYNYLQQNAEVILREQRQLNLKQNNLAAFRSLHAELFSIINMEGIVKNMIGQRRMKEIMKDRLLQNVKNAQSFAGQNYFYQVRSFYFLQKGDNKKAYAEQKELVSLFEKESRRITLFTHSYFSAVANYASRCIVLRKFNEALMCIQKLEDLARNNEVQMSPSLSTEIKIISFERKMLVLVFSGEFDKAIALCKTISPHFAKRKGFELFHYLFTAVSYFNKGEFRAALKTLHPVFGLQNEKVRMDFVYSAHFLHLAVHFELGNHESIPHFVRSSQSFFRSRKSEFRSPEIIFNFFNRVVKTKDKREFEELCKLTLIKLKPLSRVPSEKMLLENFDIMKWISEK